MRPRSRAYKPREYNAELTRRRVALGDLAIKDRSPAAEKDRKPAADALQQSRIALQGRVGAEKRDQTLKAITVDAQRYIELKLPATEVFIVRELTIAAYRAAVSWANSLGISVFIKVYSGEEICE